MEKITRKRKTKEPCSVCSLNPTLCICSQIPRLQLKTRVCLVIHAKELKRTTNTGRLAIHALENSEMRVRGDARTTLDLRDVAENPNYETWLFYPSEEAEELTSLLVEKAQRPIQLIVPDGNWRQASKVHYRHSELKNIRRVKIAEPNHSPQHLRAETTAEGMATLQAIAKALGVIEGEAVRKKMLDLYEAKLRATLIGRGHKISDDKIV